MNRDPGVWTYEDCALVLIDYQREVFEVIRSETGADLAELNVRLLAKTAKALDMLVDAKDHPAVEDQSGLLFRLTGDLDLGAMCPSLCYPVRNGASR
jgi:hypothetical protein